MNYYDMIFKRKSFHLFRGKESISEQELQALEDFIQTVRPLDSSIKTKMKIVPEKETSCKRGGDYCIEFYSEEKENYLRNVGYLGEQIDLWLADLKMNQTAWKRCLWRNIKLQLVAKFTYLNF